jgi:hypothetical protein
MNRVTLLRKIALIAALSACTAPQARRDDVAGQLRAWVIDGTTHNYIEPTEATITAALERMK